MSPKLELLLRQDNPEKKFFHIWEVPLGEQPVHCVESGVELAVVYVSSDEPLRQHEPMCAAHCNLAHAEWILSL